MRTIRILALVISVLCVSLFAPRADAFCGFYVAPGDEPLVNEASMVVLMRDGTRTVMTMSNDYKGPASDFAMVVPVPVVLQKESVKTLDPGVFQRLEQLTAPRLVEYWEQDPCNQLDDLSHKKGGAGPPKSAGIANLGGAGAGYGVTVEAEFAVGEYEIVILGAKESDGLERWLVDNKYRVPHGIGPALAPYIKEQQKFFVARVDVKKVKTDASGVVVLSPLRFSFESTDFRLPVRLGLLNATKAQDLIVWILAENQRYDVANYENAFIPTNLEVTDATRASFRGFYAALFDETLKRKGGKAIVTEYSWATSSCDPCPVPPLEQKDLATLGADVLIGMVPASYHAPMGDVTIGASKSKPPLTDADVVLARNRWRFKACHGKALASDPSAAGVASIALKIDPSGTVLSSSATKTTAPPALTGCAVSAMRSMKFASSSSDVELSLDLTFKAPPKAPSLPDAGVGDAGPMKLARTPSFVVTRLHARYDATTLGDDLVFRTADAVVGGREMMGSGGTIEQGAIKSSSNAFQARYVIRHPWTGAVTCAEPRRGIWGGPPGKAMPPAAPATGLARADRSVTPASFLASKSKTEPSKAAVPSAPAEPQAKKQCGCSTPGSERSNAPFAVGLALIAWSLRRRR